MTIPPSIGRVVWFTPSLGKGADNFVDHGGYPFAALITYVWNDSLINLVVFDHDGVSHSRTSVPLVQEGGERPEEGYYASWMPFQVGQARAQAQKS